MICGKTIREETDDIIRRFLVEYGVNDVEFSLGVAATMMNYHGDLFKYNRWREIKYILEALAVAYPTLWPEAHNGANRD